MVNFIALQLEGEKTYMLKGVGGGNLIDFLKVPFNPSVCLILLKFFDFSLCYFHLYISRFGAGTRRFWHLTKYVQQVAAHANIIGNLRSISFIISILEITELKFKTTYVLLLFDQMVGKSWHFSLHFLCHPCLCGTYRLIQGHLNSKDKLTFPITFAC